MTSWRRLTGDLVHRIEDDLLAVLDGLDPNWLDARIEPGTNSIGWLSWHLTRSHDRNISEIRGSGQLWITDGWHAEFDLAPDPHETGYQHTPARAAAFRSPAPDVIRGYHRAAVAMFDDYLATVTDDDLERLAPSPTLATAWPVRRRLTGVLTEGLQHVGQAAMIRGILHRRTLASHRP